MGLTLAAAAPGLALHQTSFCAGVDSYLVRPRLEEVLQQLGRAGGGKAGAHDTRELQEALCGEGPSGFAEAAAKGRRTGGWVGAMQGSRGGCSHGCGRLLCCG